MLRHLRVLDLTDHRADLGPMILAGLGADVIKVEPPYGCEARRAGPLDPAQPDGLASLRFHAFNRGKRSVVIDLDRTEGRRQFNDLVASADFLFENFVPGAAAARGIGYDHLRAANPRLIYVALSPFGQDGPYAKHLATDLTLSAMGGLMALNGEADRQPVRITVPQAWYHGAAESATAALTAYFRRLHSGEGQFVDVSVQAGVFWTGLNAMIAHAIQGYDIERSGTILQLGTVSLVLCHPCADGEVVLILTGATMINLLNWMLDEGTIDQEWFDAEDWSTYEVRLLTGAQLAHPLADLYERVRVYCTRHKKADLFARALAAGATIAPVNTVADVLALRHFYERKYWESYRLPDGTELRMPGQFVRLSRTPVSLSRRAPAAGEHTAEVLASAAPATPEPRLPSAAARAALPFEGVKIADFSWIGVGPITARYFADHGATVVHVESETRADRLRLVGPFKDQIQGVNRSQFFASFNTSKLSLALDLKKPEGIEVAKRLIAWADICIDSFTPGTMADLGLTDEVVFALNPRVLLTSTCLMGAHGPAALLAGYGYHAAAISGFFEVTGWSDRPPAGPFNAYTDTIAPRFLAATLMAALDHRRRTGVGQRIEQSQAESALYYLAPEFLDYQRSGRMPRRAGNEDPNACPHDAYPCAGIDEWCAIAVETDEQWNALRRCMGEPAWAMAPELDSLAGRRAQRAMIDRMLGTFTVAHEPRALMQLLQHAGVPAGMVQRSSDLMEDPQLQHRRFFRPLLHPEMGEVPYEGHQFRIAGYDSGPRFPAPCLGQHSIPVIQEILGFSDEDLARIAASGALI